jgi:RNA polymerase sigma factor (sigma-70 family)
LFAFRPLRLRRAQQMYAVRPAGLAAVCAINRLFVWAEGRSLRNDSATPATNPSRAALGDDLARLLGAAGAVAQGCSGSRHDSGVTGCLASVWIAKVWTPCGLRPSYSCGRLTNIGGPEGDEVLRRLRERLLAFACRLLRQDVAEDLVQETFVLLTTKYGHVHEPDERVRLGIAILRKKRAGHFRKIRRRGEDSTVEPADAGLEDQTPDPEELAHRQLLAQRLRSAISKSSGRCRELLRLKLEERTFPEIAEIMEAKLNTVYSWDHRCTERLRVLVMTREVQR